jgi:hypothetical protein
MESVDDVYLLRPGSKLLDLPTSRPPLGVTALPDTSFSVHVYPYEVAAEIELCAASDASALGTFVTEDAANNFPALPVRTDRVVLVLCKTAPTEPGFPCQASPQRVVKLAPTARSLLR